MPPEPVEPSGWRRRLLPRSLFWRSLIIIVAPIVLLQLVVTYLFFERHFEVTTIRLSRAMGANIQTLLSLSERPGALPIEEITATASQSLGLTVGFLPGAQLPQTPSSAGGALDDILKRELVTQMHHPVWFNTERPDGYVDIRVGLPTGVLQVLAERKYVVATNIHIFFVYMVAASFILIVIAVLFLRNQVRPIQRLAEVAEDFGKGRDAEDFRPSGATEVRAAGAAFIDMRERIRRHLQQRTDMLAGVSHDLRTPLTRMKLQLAMMPVSTDIEDLKQDIRDMEHMLDEYLDFARGQGGEAAAMTNLSEVLLQSVEAVERARDADNGGPITCTAGPGILANIRRNAIKRCLVNLIDNAVSHASRVDVTLEADRDSIVIAIDDNGPGIPPDKREEVFRPFHRLDTARNLDRGGVGLGLAIARDIARGHGGDIVLGESILGGLRAELRLPV